ncbi:hypothetical protein Glove_13g196 [Diversispora epigaea]|uniref:BACK domain-containing protein n=1 Tax=Diversispora epigaea TaxID=1348612 RepID=A0A397JMI1_9GLOM|nr:hypothetical protein Glove_13g196 [Diversispora epigaea]
MALKFFDKLSQNFIELLNEKMIIIGIVNLENVETRFVFNLMLAAIEFELKKLTNKLETHLIDTKASWLKTYFSLICRTIFNKNDFKKLENYCNDIIAKHPNIIFDSSDFYSRPESALDYVVKWRIVQNPALTSNLEEWSKENFLSLKTTLQQCLPLIRYFHIPNTELFDKIRPYKKLLARSFVVTELPPRAEIPKEPFSTIISEENVA